MSRWVWRSDSARPTRASICASAAAVSAALGLHLGLGGVVVGLAALHDGHRPGDECDDERGGDGDQQPAQPAPRSAGGANLGVPGVAAGLDEVALQVGPTRPSMSSASIAASSRDPR